MVIIRRREGGRKSRRGESKDLVCFEIIFYKTIHRESSIIILKRE
jgi:hypothetical protein